MKKGFLFKLGICLFVLCFYMFSYIEKQNRITKLRMEIPELVKDIKTLKDEVTKLKYEVDHFENPLHLMELVQRTEFSHLKYPFFDDVLTVSDKYALNDQKKELFLEFLASSSNETN